MIESLPIYISIVFIISTTLTGYFFLKACNFNKFFIYVSIGWLSLTGILAYSLFYTNTTAIPPRFILVIAPVLILIIILFNTKKGKLFIDKLDQKWLTILHVVRIPVEFVLLWLFVHSQVPELMTFEGYNYDILAGITAPIVFYFGYINKKLSKTILIAWNILFILFLLNIIVLALLSAPLPFQQLAFEQPNVGVLYFPFIWLPAYVVPVVMFSHFASLRQLIYSS